MATKVRSHAKINLGLSIGAPRADGYHALATVYQTLEMHDLVMVTARVAEETTIRLASNDGRVPTDAKNTAWRMVSLALDALGVTAEVEIHIEKRLPVQGGLGAGSANAVAALVGLECELGVGGLAEEFSIPGLKSETWGTQAFWSPIEQATAGPSNSLRSAQDDSICCDPIYRIPALTCLLQRVGLGHAHGQVADAADHAYSLRHADCTARVQKVEEV
jgi:hypothetical protein